MIRLPWVSRRAYNKMVGRAAARVARLNVELATQRRRHATEVERLCAAHARQLEAARANVPPTVADLLRQIADLELRAVTAEHAVHERDGEATEPIPAGAR